MCAVEPRLCVSGNSLQGRKTTATIQPVGEECEAGIADSEGSERHHHRDIRISSDPPKQESKGSAHEKGGGSDKETIYPKNEKTDILAGQIAHKTYSP